MVKKIKETKKTNDIQTTQTVVNADDAATTIAAGGTNVAELEHEHSGNSLLVEPPVAETSMGPNGPD